MNVDYRPTTANVVNNGHTIQVNCDPGSSLNLDGVNFKLLQYHFHHPSEAREHARLARLYVNILIGRQDDSFGVKAEHEFAEQINQLGPITHVRVNVFPDGGISRLRLFGKVAK